MKNIIITLLLISTFAIGAGRPTHYANGKWRVCDEQTYDAGGNLIHGKYGDISMERWYRYDSKGNSIYEWTDKGGEYWKDYDAKGNVIHEKDNSGNEIWFEYDSKGNNIRTSSNKGDIWWNYYDTTGNLIHKKWNRVGNVGEWWYKYDSNGNKIYTLNRNGKEFWYEYFTASGEKLNSTYNYDKKKSHHIKPVGTILRCRVEDW